MAENILILGASSSIARALAGQLARDGRRLLLCGRDLEDAEQTAADLRIRDGVDAQVLRFDALDFGSHPAFFDAALAHFKGELHGVIVCFGFMANQADAARQPELAKQMIDTNYTAAVSILNLAANYMEPRRKGFLCALSSVAGDRGRQSNYIYGSSKAALTAYLQGLRNRLSHANVPVVTIKPGFVDTAMTWGLLNDGPLVASPERLARDICRAIRGRKAEVYSPWFWWLIMEIIRSIPERIFMRLKM